MFRLLFFRACPILSIYTPSSLSPIVILSTPVLLTVFARVLFNLTVGMCGGRCGDVLDLQAPVLRYDVEVVEVIHVVSAYSRQGAGVMCWSLLIVQVAV